MTLGLGGVGLLLHSGRRTACAPSAASAFEVSGKFKGMAIGVRKDRVTNTRRRGISCEHVQDMSCVRGAWACARDQGEVVEEGVGLDEGAHEELHHHLKLHTLAHAHK